MTTFLESLRWFSNYCDMERSSCSLLPSGHSYKSKLSINQFSLNYSSTYIIQISRYLLYIFGRAVEARPTFILKKLKYLIVPYKLDCLTPEFLYLACFNIDFSGCRCNRVHLVSSPCIVMVARIVTQKRQGLAPTSFFRLSFCSSSSIGRYDLKEFHGTIQFWSRFRHLLTINDAYIFFTVHCIGVGRAGFGRPPQK